MFWQLKLSDSTKLTLKVLFRIIFVGILILFGLLVYFYGRNSDETEQIYLDDNLIFAQTLCRHGDRNIVEPYPNDPWHGIEYWPEGYSQLTKDVDRVLMSAQVTLVGLFPPSKKQIWNEHLPWLPIPVHTAPLNVDHRLSPKEKCSRFDYVMIQYQNTTAYKNLFEKYGPLIKYLETNSGMELTTLMTICRLFDALLTEKSRGYRLPSWAQDVMIPGGEFERLTLHGYEQWAAMPELKKIRSGFLLKDILDRFANKSRSILLPDRSLWMYFAHDLTIVNLLQSMDMFTRKLVPTVSCLFFELYQSDKSHYVQIFYKNSTEENIPAMEIPKCGTKCPLNKMFELFSNILPKNSYEEECRLRYGESLPPGGNPENFEL